MRARLIHNPTAGDAKHTADALIAALRSAGFDVHHTPPPSNASFAKKSHWKTAALEWPEETFDLVVAAGGDGTIARTVRALAGRPTALAIAPLGTANNIARSLGLHEEPEAMLERLADPIRRKMDIGIARGSWGELRFVEAAGVGLFQHVLEHEASSKDKAPDKARRILLAELEGGHAPRPWELTLDGVTSVDEFLLIEVMLMRSTGPRLHFAPGADPFDGYFDVVIARERDRKRLRRYLKALLQGDEGATPDLETMRAAHAHIRLAGSSIRVDSHVLPEEGAPPSEGGDFLVMPGAVELWLPSPL